MVVGCQWVCIFVTDGVAIGYTLGNLASCFITHIFKSSDDKVRSKASRV